MNNKLSKITDTIKKVKPTGFAAFAVTATSIILLGTAASSFLLFGTDSIVNIEEEYVESANDFQRTTVSATIVDTELVAKSKEQSGKDFADAGRGTPKPVDGEVVELTYDEDGDGTVNFDIEQWASLDKSKQRHFYYSYMGWQMITSPSSDQYALREYLYPLPWTTSRSKALGVDEAFDNLGFARTPDGRYLVAVSSQNDGGIGLVGMELDVHVDTNYDGEPDTVIYCLVGDIKSSGDASWTVWGHSNASSGQLCTIEFIVNHTYESPNGKTIEKWYNPNVSKYVHTNPGQPGWHAEWVGNICYIARGQVLDYK